MRRIKQIIYSFSLLSLLLLAAPTSTQGQCPMCKMAAESNLDEGGTAGKGLNKGILMLFSMPYVLVGGVAYVWYRNRREDEDELGINPSDN